MKMDAREKIASKNPELKKYIRILVKRFNRPFFKRPIMEVSL